MPRGRAGQASAEGNWRCLHGLGLPGRAPMAAAGTELPLRWMTGLRRDPDSGRCIRAVGTISPASGWSSMRSPR